MRICDCPSCYSGSSVSSSQTWEQDFSRTLSVELFSTVILPPPTSDWVIFFTAPSSVYSWLYTLGLSLEDPRLVLLFRTRPAYFPACMLAISTIDRKSSFLMPQSASFLPLSSTFCLQTKAHPSTLARTSASTLFLSTRTVMPSSYSTECTRHPCVTQTIFECSLPSPSTSDSGRERSTCTIWSASTRLPWALS